MQFFMQRLGVYLFFVFIFCFSLRYLSDHDLGFQLKGGQWIWEHKAVPGKDTYTYTVNQNDYINSHWLFQLVVYGIYLAGGYRALSVWVAVLVTLIFFIQWKLVRQHVSPVIAILLLVWGAFIMQFRFHLRPELITWLCMCLSLLIYQQYRQSKGKGIYLLLAVQLLWSNCHGLFILGWAQVAAYTAGDWWEHRKPDRQLLLLTVLHPLVSLLTPYGFKGLLFPFYLYTRLQGGHVMNEAISELKSIFEIQPTPNTPFSPGILYYGFGVMVCISILLFLLTFRKRKMFQWLIWMAFLFLAFKAIRNIPLFIFVTLPFMAAALADLEPWQRLQAQTKKYHTALSGVLSYALALFILLLLNNGYYRLNRNGIRTGMGIHAQAYPIGCANFINTNALDGKLLNDFNTGSWLEWQLAQPVFIDGRLEVMQEAFFTAYKNSEQPDSLKKLLHKYQPQMILFDHMSGAGWHVQLNKLKEDWRMVFADDVAVLYLRKDYREEFQPFSFRLFLVQNKINKELTETQKWELLKSPLRGEPWRWWQALTGKLQYPFDELMRPAIFAYRNKEYKVAERLYLEFLKRSNGAWYEVFVNLGSLYTQTGELTKAIYCMKRAEEVDPDNPIVREKIDVLRKKLNKQQKIF